MAVGGYAGLMSDVPDWQVSPSTQSPNVFSAFTQNLAPGNHPGPVTPVYSWASVVLTVVPSAGACKIVLQHYADSAGTQLIGTDTWSVSTVTALTVRCPLRGPYARVSVNVTSAGNLTAETFGMFQTQPADRISYPVAAQYLASNGTTLPANGTATLTMAQIVSGSANWAFVPFDTSGQLNPYIQAVDELGNILTRVFDGGNPTIISGTILELPDKILQVVVVNNDTVNAHTYGFNLTVPAQ